MSSQSFQQHQSQRMEDTTLFLSQTQMVGDDRTNSQITPLQVDNPAWGKLVSKDKTDNHIEYFLKYRQVISSSTNTLEQQMTNAYIIGRHTSCDIRVTDTRVSKKHCIISNYFAMGKLKVYIEDTSVNGTQINHLARLKHGERVELHSGDEIYLCVDKSVAAFIFVNISEHQADQRQAVISLHSQIQLQNNIIRSPIPGANTHVKKQPRIEDDYIVGNELGRGQSGLVRFCRHKRTKMDCAVKIIDTKSFGFHSGLSAAEIRQEAEILSSLDHPQIIKIFDTYESEGVLYIVMEYVAGGDLFDRVNDRRKYTEENAREVMQKILSAVRYLHGRNIIHRDLKPENILLVSKGSDTDCKITDFGLAKKANQDGLKTFCGTPQYFAPEILKRRNTVFGAGRYGASADMWSVGVILYILLSGTFPFSEEHMYEEMERASYSFRGPEWGHISAAAKHLISQMMELKPDRRITADKALKHPWILNQPMPTTATTTATTNMTSTVMTASNNNSGTTASSTVAAAAGADMTSPRPFINQLSWGRSTWTQQQQQQQHTSSTSSPVVGPHDTSISEDILAKLSHMKLKSTVGITTTAVALKNQQAVYPPVYKSAAVAKKQIENAVELPHDRITEFDSISPIPLVMNTNNKGNRNHIKNSAAGVGTMEKYLGEQLQVLSTQSSRKRAANSSSSIISSSESTDSNNNKGKDVEEPFSASETKRQRQHDMNTVDMLVAGDVSENNIENVLQNSNNTKPAAVKLAKSSTIGMMHKSKSEGKLNAQRKITDLFSTSSSSRRNKQ